MTANRTSMASFRNSVISKRQLLIEKVEVEKESIQHHETGLMNARQQISNHEKMMESKNDELQTKLAALNTGEMYLRSLKKSVVSLQQEERTLEEMLALEARKAAAKHKELSEDETQYSTLLTTLRTTEMDLEAYQCILELEKDLKELQERNASKETYLRSLKEQIARQEKAATEPFLELARLYGDSEEAKKSIECLEHQIQQLEKDLKMRQLEKPQQKTASGEKPAPSSTGQPKLLPVPQTPSEKLAPSPARQSAHSIYFSKQNYQALALTTPSKTKTLQTQDTTAAAPLPHSPPQPALFISAPSNKAVIHRALELLESPRRQTVSSASSTYLDDLKTLMSTPRPNLAKRPLEPDTGNKDTVAAKQSRNERDWLLPEPAAINKPKSAVQAAPQPRVGALTPVPLSGQYHEMQMKSPELSCNGAKEQGTYGVQKAFTITTSTDSNEVELLSPPPKSPSLVGSSSTKLSGAESDSLNLDNFTCDPATEVYDVFGDENASVQETSGFKLAPASFGKGTKNFFNF